MLTISSKFGRLVLNVEFAFEMLDDVGISEGEEEIDEMLSVGEVTKVLFDLTLVEVLFSFVYS